MTMALVRCWKISRHIRTITLRWSTLAPGPQAGSVSSIPDPFVVVRESVMRAVERLAPYNIVVRPWLQDFHDYQSQKLFYGAEEVLAQIRASAAAGAKGFMLWDPSLNYHTDRAS